MAGRMEMSQVGQVGLGDPMAHAQTGRGCGIEMRAECCQVQKFQDKTEVILRNLPVFKR